MILVRFYHTFAEARTFGIRYSALCFFAWGVVLVEISQMRERLWEVAGFVAICAWPALQGLYSALISHTQGSCLTCEHLSGMGTRSFSQSCFYAFIYLCFRPSKCFPPVHSCTVFMENVSECFSTLSRSLKAELRSWRQARVVVLFGQRALKQFFLCAFNINRLLFSKHGVDLPSFVLFCF